MNFLELFYIFFDNYVINKTLQKIAKKFLKSNAQFILCFGLGNKMSAKLKGEFL